MLNDPLFLLTYLETINEPGQEFFLDFLHYRATKAQASLSHQSLRCSDTRNELPHPFWYFPTQTTCGQHFYNDLISTCYRSCYSPDQNSCVCVCVCVCVGGGNESQNVKIIEQNIVFKTFERLRRNQWH